MAQDTQNSYFSKPSVGGDTDTWGTTLNANWDTVDSVLAGDTDILALSVSGSVGIGTTSPDGKLDIEGDFEATKALVLTNTKGAGKVSYIRSHGANGEALSLYHDGQRRQVWDSTGYISFEGTGGEERMRIDSSGKLGIGTTSPDRQLTIANPTDSADMSFISGNAGNALIYFADTDDDNIGAIGYNHEFNFMNFRTNDLERMRIDANGNVGIGNASPAARLDIHNGTALGGTNNDWLLLSRIHSYTGNQTYLEIGNLRDSTGSDWTSAGTRIQSKIDSTYMAYMQFNGTGNTHGISFGAGASTVSHDSIPEVMRINSSGVTVAGNATFDNGTSTVVGVHADNGGTAELKAYGNGQSNGRVYVGQSDSYGGGIEYCGNDDPELSGAGSDKIALFRRHDGTNEWTAKNSYNSNDWEFRGKVKADELEGTLVQSIFNQIYPVGSIFTTTSDSFNPATAFGGTWSLYGGGKVLVGDNNTTSYSAGQTGGEANHNHTTTVTRDGWGSEGVDLPRTSVDGRLVTGSGNYEVHENLESLAHASGNKAFTSNSQSNFPPYVVVKFWKRDTLA